MSDCLYGKLAREYDSFNSDYDYPSLADFLKKEISENEKSPSSIVLDLACGTGKTTLLLSEYGYDMIGIDISEEMLSCAKEESSKHGADILWLCQDMRSFELYGTADACVCTLDGINYLTKVSDLKKCFRLVHNYLIPNGIFVFDINTPYRFESVYSDNDYIIESGTSLCAWSNEYNPKSHLCKFYLSLFTVKDNGLYERNDEVQVQRCYSKRQIESALNECNFEIIHVCGDFSGKDAESHDEKWYFTARAVK